MPIGVNVLVLVFTCYFVVNHVFAVNFYYCALAQTGRTGSFDLVSERPPIKAVLKFKLPEIHFTGIAQIP